MSSRVTKFTKVGPIAFESCLAVQLAGPGLGQWCFTIQSSATNVAECFWEVRKRRSGWIGAFRQRG
jgi:hypothetical protein